MKISNELKNKYVCWGRNKEIRRRKGQFRGEKKGKIDHLPMRILPMLGKYYF